VRRYAAEQALGVDVALFGSSGGQMTSIVFVEYTGSRKAGHAAHPECYLVANMAQEGKMESGGSPASMPHVFPGLREGQRR
jgi:hypothetical protein